MDDPDTFVSLRPNTDTTGVLVGSDVLTSTVMTWPAVAHVGPPEDSTLVAATAGGVLSERDHVGQSQGRNRTRSRHTEPIITNCHSGAIGRALHRSAHIVSG